MLDIITSSIEAHGGLSRWEGIRQIKATFIPDGAALKLRGQEAFAGRPTQVTVDTRVQRVTFDPYLAPAQIGIYTPFRTAVETRDGIVLEGLDNPRHSFAFDGSPWTASQLAYFVGCALWTYFTLPFSLVLDGVQCEEIEPWTDDGETWRAVRVIFPKSYVTHSREQTLYFDDKGLIRRHDYAVEIAGGSPAAHYLHDHQKFGDFVFPTRRRIYPRGNDRRPNREIVLMSADLTDFEFIADAKPQDDWCVDTCD
ncbi:hypothetical protein HGP17_28125 [Rhizobium sp. P38BS-XIX]|uniref:hypothetical protein n=1 Tax=Rhizobium sp. P38BS-XIX TaxID=2726740 RepID=UPI0014578C7B|nr:hypothetical protein [Rhizobium sp. P38BS-XIX]NLS00715.1 hypothetical protein [Rhizobium sp. P38BS-XIX]